mgnify:CR=1 FL=1
MARRILIAVIAIIVLLSAGCRRQADNGEIPDENIENGNVAGEEDEGKDEEKIDEIQSIVDGMTLDEKIGQLFIFGIDGTEIDDYTINMIDSHKVGGFIFFGNNLETAEQTVELLNSLKERNRNNILPLFFAVDEEGGKVSRLSKFFSNLPNARTIGSINQEDISYEFGRVLAGRLKELGFNMDFAPVLDINSNPQNPVIGNRAFGSTKEAVIDNGIKVMEGINSGNIISIVKHFPGHGDTSVDSHVDLPVIGKSLEELKSLELVPFKRAIEEDVDGIMVAHILFPELDKDYPATLSENIIKNLLRDELSYDGVVISDDMTMGAIVENYSVGEAAVRFLKAGGDIVLVCHGYENQISALNRVKEEVLSENISLRELNEKVYRIIRLKMKYGLSDILVEEYDIERINRQAEELLNRIKR